MSGQNPGGCFEKRTLGGTKSKQTKSGGHTENRNHRGWVTGFQPPNQGKILPRKKREKKLCTLKRGALEHRAQMKHELKGQPKKNNHRGTHAAAKKNKTTRFSKNNSPQTIKGAEQRSRLKAGEKKTTKKDQTKRDGTKNAGTTELKKPDGDM